MIRCVNLTMIVTASNLTFRISLYGVTATYMPSVIAVILSEAKDLVFVEQILQSLRSLRMTRVV
jgi:hypothetical protein